MSKYEHPNVIGERAEAINAGADLTGPLLPGEYDSIAIAMRELREKRSPMVITRILPDGTREHIPASALLHNHHF